MVMMCLVGCDVLTNNRKTKIFRFFEKIDGD